MNKLWFLIYHVSASQRKFRVQLTVNGQILWSWGYELLLLLLFGGSMNHRDKRFTWGLILIEFPLFHLDTISKEPLWILFIELIRLRRYRINIDSACKWLLLETSQWFLHLQFGLHPVTYNYVATLIVFLIYDVQFHFFHMFRFFLVRFIFDSERIWQIFRWKMLFIQQFFWTDSMRLFFQIREPIEKFDHSKYCKKW